MKIHWIFRVVSLFNYQGSLFFAFASDFVIISHRFFLVKYFFKKFFKFFSMCCCSLEQLAYLTTTRFVCQPLFLSFSNFFNCSNCLFFSFISNASLSYHKLSCLSTTFFNFFSKVFLLLNGDGGIWTLAPVARPTPLAGAPLQPLEYISLPENSLPRYSIFIASEAVSHQCEA